MTRCIGAVLLLGLPGCRSELPPPAQSSAADRCAFRADEGIAGAKGLAFDELERNPMAFEGQRVRVRGRLRAVSAYKCFVPQPEGPFFDLDREMWLPDEGSFVFDCKPLQPSAISVATTANCTADWPDPWIVPPVEDCIVGINCAGDQTGGFDLAASAERSRSIPFGWRTRLPVLELASCSHAYGSGERYGLALSAMHALECDGRMASISGTIRGGALVRVTAIEPE